MSFAFESRETGRFVMVEPSTNVESSAYVVKKFRFCQPRPEGLKVLEEKRDTVNLLCNNLRNVMHK